MASLGEGAAVLSIFGERPRMERRRFRRQDMQGLNVEIAQIGPKAEMIDTVGQLMDLSPGGMRIRTTATDLVAGAQLKVRVELPAYAGISPFVTADGTGKGTNVWTGKIQVTRVFRIAEDKWDIACQTLDMRDIDRGMLTLYLSAHPLAA
jgi:hypothetical protein